MLGPQGKDLIEDFPAVPEFQSFLLCAQGVFQFYIDDPGHVTGDDALIHAPQGGAGDKIRRVQESGHEPLKFPELGAQAACDAKNAV